jgi:hypothetical protein
MFLYAKTNLLRVMKTLKYANAIGSAISVLLFFLICALQEAPSRPGAGETPIFL